MIKYKDYEPPPQLSAVINGKVVPFDRQAAARLALDAMLLATVRRSPRRARRGR